MTQAQSRVQRLMSEADAAGLDAVCVVPGPNMVHLTGQSFHLSERPVVAFFTLRGEIVLVLPLLEAKKAESLPFEVEPIIYSDADGPQPAFDAARERLELRRARLGVEGRRIRFLELNLIGNVEEIRNADMHFAKGRMVKDPPEIASLRAAAAIAETAYRETLRQVGAGVSEKEIVAELALQLLRAGSEPDFPFQPCAASGPSGANPHAVPGTRRLEPGNLLTVDWGATCDGYFSDITRTVAVAGAPLPTQLATAYDVVREANRAGRAAARPGVTAQAVDRAARSVIERAGLGDFFTHRTGHGLGLEVHEEPDLKEGCLTRLEPGMTFTVEPGVYIPGLGGVRIEDDLVILETGAESLTSLPRKLTTIG